MLRRILLLLLLIVPALAASEKCAFCRHDGGQYPLREVDYATGSQWVCQRCLDKLSRCSVCRLATDRKLYRDGRTLCASCLKLNLANQAQAESLYNKVVKFVDGLLGDRVKPLPPVRICDDDELQTRFIEGGRAMQVAGFYQPYNPEQIYIRSYETLVEAGGTLAHEYTHAWQSRHAVQQDRALKEGFANWVEYHYLVSIGEPGRAASLTQSSDPDYGASLQRLLELERKSGKAAVIKLGRTGTKI
ncbi:hypothetical protein DYH09_03360 [bacterium CPR1]|nr:hypothetical protein [bacterium CPR1]